MKVFMLATSLCLLTLNAPVVYSDDKAAPPQCLDEKIQIENLKAANATLQMQIMQAQFPQAEQAAKAAKAEAERLNGLVPKKTEEKPKK